MDPKLQRGPTIPFVLGACGDPLTAEASSKLGEPDLRSLLAAMRDETPEPYCIEILLCPYLKTYIASALIDPPNGRARIPSPDDSSRALYSCDKIGEHEGARLQLARGGILVDARRGHFERTVLSARWKLPALRQFGSRQHQGAADQSVSHRAFTIAADAADSVHLTFLASSRRSASRLNSSTYCSARSGRSVTPTR
jgi:hypothetical protein